MDYAICIRKEAAMCGAIFIPEDFNVNVAGTTGGGCKGDYFSFGASQKCGTNKTVQNGVRYGTYLEFFDWWYKKIAFWREK